MASLSPPFASRELNGETLLDELRDLRRSAVPQRHLNDCAVAVRMLRKTSVAEVPRRFRELAQDRFANLPEVAGMLVRWAQHVHSDADLAALCGHFERLALASALLNAIYRSGGRLPGGAR